MRFLPFMPFLLIVGCGGSVESTAASPDASSDTSGTDSSSTETLFVLDEGVETVTACPEAQPAEGAFCIGVGTVVCAYPTCGGMLTMACEASTWTLLSKPVCESSLYCPQGKPVEGSSCADAADGRLCNYWPVSESACVACTCSAGVWACKGSCDQLPSTCNNGTPCSPNTGCGLGKCSTFCGCGTEGKLVCKSTLC